ncbi:toll/interleukin-1 receptor domain-containing protein [Thermomonas sp. HDW16]|uniref:toll/interleukin-1 receptor domain-containing protein n=1 Tax=Thermomonas sp. HDW16 TaxID=2714945 RepID=UPI00140D627E|nr:toll/interleukin-1 receptor domain-containing protein [Thermomonas sp. HDW16]QIL19798.1 toll/interleukin-1 receptor domain-containing protein [Thermomonas sp. HDW16]
MSSLFFSYSHKDEALRDRLEVHLASLKRSGAIATWHDRRITAGDSFSQRIDEHLERADIILLLISPDFLASDYCHDIEMQRALQRHAEGSARVIPVILKPCDWQHSPFSSLLAAPTDGKPITRWPDEDEAFLDVVRQIRAALPAPGSVAFDQGLPAATHAVVQPPIAGPRSSNLRLRKQFSDADRDQFIEDAFEFMGRFFENLLAELCERNASIEGRFKRIDANHFSAVIYESGKARSQCTIRLGGPFGKGISYSSDVGGSGNSWNEMLSVECDDQHQFLRCMGMSMMGNHRDQQLSHEGAAEYFWSMLIAPLQHH